MTIATFTGRVLAPLAPQPEAIVIEDIAHHLALTNRFLGATSAPYSVAQHSVLVSLCCEPEDALHGLLHDASEAYLGDVIRPVKALRALGGFLAVEAQLQAVIFARFGLATEMPASVKAIDDRMVVTEALDLFAPGAVPAWALERQSARLFRDQRIEPWPPCCAESAFIDRFARLVLERGTEARG